MWTRSPCSGPVEVENAPLPVTTSNRARPGVTPSVEAITAVRTSHPPRSQSLLQTICFRLHDQHGHLRST